MIPPRYDLWVRRQIASCYEKDRTREKRILSLPVLNISRQNLANPRFSVSLWWVKNFDGIREISIWTEYILSLNNIILM